MLDGDGVNADPGTVLVPPKGIPDVMRSHGRLSAPTSEKIGSCPRDFNRGHAPCCSAVLPEDRHGPKIRETAAPVQSVLDLAEVRRSDARGCASGGGAAESAEGRGDPREGRTAAA